MSAFSGQILLVGTVVSQGFDPGVAKGARCPVITVVDCDCLNRQGRLAAYENEEGLNAGAFLDDTLGRRGWCDITVSACLPVEGEPEGWEPELKALLRTASIVGFAHMVFEPASQAGRLLH